MTDDQQRWTECPHCGGPVGDVILTVIGKEPAASYWQHCGACEEGIKDFDALMRFNAQILRKDAWK